MARIDKSLPSQVSVAGPTNLTTSYKFGTGFAPVHAESLDAWIACAAAATGGGGNLTSIQVKLQSSEDNSNWVDEYTVKASNNTAAIEQSITCTAGLAVVTAYERLRFLYPANCSYLRLAYKATCSGGGPIAGDTVAISLRLTGEER